MLRVEYKGQPYDWFNLDDMGALIQSEEFASTLKENINHYFEVGFDDQAVFDEDGLLVAPADFLRSLRHPRPYFRVYSLRQMPQDLKEQTAEKLSILAQEVEKLQQALGSAGAPIGTLTGPVLDPRPEAASIRSAPQGTLSTMPASLPAEPPWSDVKAACPKCGQPYERENSLFCAKCGSLRTEELPRQLDLPAPVGTTTSLADRLAGRAASPCTLPSALSAMPLGTGCPGLALPAVSAATEQPQGSRYSPCMVQFEAAPKTVTCPSCGGTNLADSEFCRHCGASLVLTTEPAPIRSISFANGKDYAFTTPLLEVTLRKEASGPATTCSCGNVFMPDAEFCRKCGLKRDMVSRPDRFGFANVPGNDGRSLQVTWIDPAGLLARWNSMHPESQVKEGHLIVSVNGISEDVEAMRVQLQMQSIQMSIKEEEALAPEHFMEPATSGGCEGTKLVLPQEVTLPQYSSCGNLYMGTRRSLR